MKIWYSVGTAIIPGLLVPLLASYFESLTISSRFAFWAMLLGGGVSTASLLYGQLNTVEGVPGYWLGIEPMYSGLAISLAVWGIGRAAQMGKPSLG